MFQDCPEFFFSRFIFIYIFSRFSTSNSSDVEDEDNLLTFSTYFARQNRRRETANSGPTDFSWPFDPRLGKRQLLGKKKGHRQENNRKKFGQPLRARPNVTKQTFGTRKICGTIKICAATAAVSVRVKDSAILVCRVPCTPPLGKPADFQG